MANKAGKQAVGTQQAIEHNFEHFDVDDDEPRINNEVHNGHRQVFEHLFLPKSQQQQVAPPGSGIGGNGFGAAHQHIAAQHTYFF